MIKKQIFFDTTFLHYGDDLRGIPQVIFQLVRLFLHSEDFGAVRFIATKKVRLHFLLPLGVPAERIEIVPAVPLVPNDLRFHGFLCGLRYWKIKQHAAIIIHPEYRTALRSPIAQAVLYHDFIFLSDYGSGGLIGYPRIALKKLYRCYIRYKLSVSCRAHYLLTVSESTKRHLLTFFPQVSAESVSVLYNGIRFKNRAESTPKSVCSSHVMFLSVGGVDDPRKNFFGLIENITVIANRRPFHLHIVGKSHPAILEKLSALVASLHLESSISFHGTVPDDRLHDFYSQADFFLFPSLFEGFGLPLVEAMAHGCVVCAFNNSSIPEIGGDAIVIAENNDFAAWGAALERFIRDPTAYRRFSKKALLRAMAFSEDRMFERYGTYFKKMLGV